MRTTGMPISGRVRSTAIGLLEPDRPQPVEEPGDFGFGGLDTPAGDRLEVSRALAWSHQRARLRVAAAKRRRIVVAGLDVLARADDVGRAHLGRFEDRAPGARSSRSGWQAAPTPEMTDLARAVDDEALERADADVGRDVPDARRRARPSRADRGSRETSDRRPSPDRGAGNPVRAAGFDARGWSRRAR